MSGRMKSLMFGALVVGLIGCNGGPQQQTKEEQTGGSAEEMESDQTAGEESEPEVMPAEQIRRAREAKANKPPTAGPTWGYGDDTGPEQWGTLAPEFAMCDLGKNQSPIDLADALVVDDLPEPEVDYGEAPNEFAHKGYAIQVNYPSGNEMSVGEKTFNLLQMHFHTPAEHAVDGERHPLEAHFVHADGDGNLAVLGVFFEEGEENEQLSALLEDAPENKGDTVSLDDTEFASAEMLPDELSAFRYNGSLTTPPCSEGVRFNILTEPVTASEAQIDEIRETVGHDNARPLQPTNARTIVR